MVTMGFIQKQSNTEIPLVKGIFTNAICYGQTGSGKTTAFILPNIENRIKLDHGILVYDFKGNLHEQIKFLAHKYNKLDDVIEIGKPWGQTIDILKNANSRTLHAIFDTNSGKHRDSFWTNGSKTLFESLYKLLNYQNKVIKSLVNIIPDFKDTQGNNISYLLEFTNPTLVNIHTISNSPDLITEFFEMFDQLNKDCKMDVQKYLIQNGDSLKKKQKRVINNLLFYSDKAKEEYKKLSEYHVMKNDGSTHGKNSMLWSMNSSLLGAASSNYFSKDEINIAEELKKQKIIVINVQELNNQTVNMLNISIYDDLLKNVTASNKNKITIFIDEAHKVLTEGYLPDVDLCRENRFEYIFATQDLSLLEHSLGKLTTFTLLRNVAEQYSFETNDLILKKFEYKNLKSRQKLVGKPIFIPESESVKVEYLYQKNNNIFRYVDKKTDKKFILRFNSSLHQMNKVQVFYLKTQKIKVIEYKHENNYVDDFLNLSFIKKKKSKKTPLDETEKDEKGMQEIPKVEKKVSQSEQALSKKVEEMSKVLLAVARDYKYFFNHLKEIDKDVNKLKEIIS